jgi:Leucine Rich repeat
MSWINQGDLSQALTLFPALEDLRARGQQGLSFSPGHHSGLTSLSIETGGMPKAVLEGLQDSVFPHLERLELWLGTEEYGFDGSLDDVLPFMQQGLFPKLKHLTLGNSDIADEIAQAIAEAPILAQLESLDLSLGTMTDVGAEALVTSQSIRQLKSLNLHRNYLSDAMCQRLQGLGITVDTDGQETPDVYRDEELRYVAVGE